LTAIRSRRHFHWRCGERKRRVKPFICFFRSRALRKKTSEWKAF